MSYFEIAITPLIFELERRTKSPNVENGMAYLAFGVNFRYNFRFNNAFQPQNGGLYEKFKIFEIILSSF